MRRESIANARLEAENFLLRQTLTWIVKHSLDTAARARAKETLHQLDPGVGADVDAHRSDPEIDGEWCI